MTESAATDRVEQYKAYIADLGNIGTRHSQTNTLYMSIISALLVFLVAGPARAVAQDTVCHRSHIIGQHLIPAVEPGMSPCATFQSNCRPRTRSESNPPAKIFRILGWFSSGHHEMHLSPSTGETPAKRELA